MVEVQRLEHGRKIQRIVGLQLGVGEDILAFQLAQLKVLREWLISIEQIQASE